MVQINANTHNVTRLRKRNHRYKLKSLENVTLVVAFLHLLGYSDRACFFHASLLAQERRRFDSGQKGPTLMISRWVKLSTLIVVGVLFAFGTSYAVASTASSALPAVSFHQTVAAAFPIMPFPPAVKTAAALPLLPFPPAVKTAAALPLLPFPPAAV